MAGGMSRDCATPGRATGSVIHRTAVWTGVGTAALLPLRLQLHAERRTNPPRIFQDVRCTLQTV